MSGLFDDDEDDDLPALPDDDGNAVGYVAQPQSHQEVAKRRAEEAQAGDQYAKYRTCERCQDKEIDIRSTFEGVLVVCRSCGHKFALPARVRVEAQLGGRAPYKRTIIPQ